MCITIIVIVARDYLHKKKRQGKVKEKEDCVHTGGSFSCLGILSNSDFVEVLNFLQNLKRW